MLNWSNGRSLYYCKVFFKVQHGCWNDMKWNMLDCQEKEKKLLAEHLDCTESIWEPESAIRNMLAHLSRRQVFFVEGDTWKETVTRPASLWGCHTMHVKFGFFSIGFSIKHHLIMCFTSHFLKKDSILSNHDVIKTQCLPSPFLLRGSLSW